MADRVRNGCVKTGVEFTACAEPARCIGSLEHKHTLTAPRQIGSADQAIMSSPNNDRVVSIHSRTPFFLLIFPMATLDTACQQDFRAYTLTTYLS